MLEDVPIIIIIIIIIITVIIIIITIIIIQQKQNALTHSLPTTTSIHVNSHGCIFLMSICNTQMGSILRQKYSKKKQVVQTYLCFIKYHMTIFDNGYMFMMIAYIKSCFHQK